MPGKRKETVDIREMLRRFQQGQSDRAIARDMRIDRKTVGRYRAWATEQDLLSGPLAPLGELHELAAKTLNTSAPPQNISTVADYQDLVIKLRKQGVEIAAIHERLKERGYGGSYSSVHRFVRRLEVGAPEATVPVETAPGEEAQADFGYAGKMLDPESGVLRKTWAFVMTLSWSRHQYVEFVFDQKAETWLRLHRNAFEFFGGVPGRVVIDNLKAAIIRACWHDPAVQQSYRECAEHYGFLIAPCRPGMPEHKGKVEQGGVHYVKRNFLGGRVPTSLTQANRDVRRWMQTTAGQRIHGTTKEQPLQRFEIERGVLLPLPTTPYDLAVWKQATLHRDCHLVFDQAYYSAPFRLVGQCLWVRGGSRVVQIYTADHQVVATHTRAERPGQRRTHLDHLPHHKVPGLIVTRAECRQQAAEIGSAVQQVVDLLLDHRPEDRLRTAGRVLRLGERFGPQRLEAACARALRFDDPSYLTVKRILEEGLDVERAPASPIAAPASAFARTAIELVGHLTGGTSWR
jgi:transposase